MKKLSVGRATLGRLPLYLQYIMSISKDTPNISATAIAEALDLGEVQVRKDLGQVCGTGKPKTGYVTAELIRQLEEYLGYKKLSHGIIVGAGQLGTALLNHDGFQRFGLDIIAAFDKKADTVIKLKSGKLVYPMEQLTDFCRLYDIHIGIITVPEEAAQEVCDILIKNQIKAIWNFARCTLVIPNDVIVRNEDLTLSLAHLNKLISKMDERSECN